MGWRCHSTVSWLDRARRWECTYALLTQRCLWIYSEAAEGTLEAEWESISYREFWKLASLGESAQMGLWRKSMPIISKCVAIISYVVMWII